MEHMNDRSPETLYANLTKAALDLAQAKIRLLDAVEATAKAKALVLTQVPPAELGANEKARDAALLLRIQDQAAEELAARVDVLCKECQYDCAKAAIRLFAPER